MESKITREAAWELLRKYNKDPFHLQHALTVEGVMRWYAEQLGTLQRCPIIGFQSQADGVE